MILPIKTSQSNESKKASALHRLIAFFELNKCDKDVNKLLYCDLPKHYTRESTKKVWNKRKRKGKDGIPETIGWLYSIYPTQIELYAMRLLLNNVCGPCSYEDLERANSVIHPSFQDAAIARKLVKDDMMWIECMKDANDSYTSIRMLRKLFVSIILRYEISNHKEFYQKCKELLDADYLHSQI